MAGNRKITIVVEKGAPKSYDVEGAVGEDCRKLTDPYLALMGIDRDSGMVQESIRPEFYETEQQRETL